MDIENVDSNISQPKMHDEAQIELLLSEKLMEGYVLLEKVCPVCSTPLVKNQKDDDDDDDEEPVAEEIDPVMIPQSSFKEPFSPIDGVPLCVSCSSHVVTAEAQVSILENCGTLKSKAGVLVASSPRYEPEIIDVTDVDDTLLTYAEEKKENDDKAHDDTNLSTRDETNLSTREETNLSTREETNSIKEEREPEDGILEEGVTLDYSVRREIATKVLGAKMLQGYSLLEQQCDKCGMPTMEYQGMVDCVVCPALVKKARKKMKAQKKLEKESKRLETHINIAKANKEVKDIEATAAEECKRHEEAVKREKERMEQEEKDRELRLLKEKEEAEMQRIQMISEERARVAAFEAEQARLIEEAQKQAEKEAQELADQAAAKAAKAREEQIKFEEIRKTTNMSVEEEYAAAQQKRKEMEARIVDDAKRLAEMEQRRKTGLATSLENMNRDVLLAENRRRLEAKAALDETIARLEQDLEYDEMENKTIKTQRRAEDDALMINLLEQEAAEKARAAEDAIRRAKAALEHVHSARREVIAQTIALAEQEVIAETEAAIKKEREDYKAPAILPSASDIARENWETLRTEGRAIMTRRVMNGWVLLAEFCEGIECHSSPLITKDGRKECVVCGGSGNGQDGTYSGSDEDFGPVIPDEDLQKIRESGVVPSTTAFPDSNMTATFSADMINQDFDTKRNMVSKEIGRRMVEGWTLLDASCPHCVMPLMMDTKGRTDICVLCGLVDTLKETDGSTLTTKALPTKTVPIPAPTREATRTLEAAKHFDTFTLSSQAHTKPYTDDAETMYTTIATVAAEDSFKSAEESTITSYKGFSTTSADSKSTQCDITESIRHYSQRQQATSRMSRSDPPESVTQAALPRKARDPDSITQPDAHADREIVAPPSVKSVSDYQSFENSIYEEATPKETPKQTTPVESVHDSEKAMTPLGQSTSQGHIEAIEVADAFLSVDAISSMIMGSNGDSGFEASMSKEEVKDLVDVYVASNLDPVSEEIKDEVAENIRRKLGVINCENAKESRHPRKFNFDTFGSEDTSVVGSSRLPPAPENGPHRRSANSSFKAGVPPRPDAGVRSPRSSQHSPRHAPRRTNSFSRSPHHGYVITERPSDVTSLGEVSRAESVASDALDSILDRIDAAKATLLRDDVTIQEQLDAANLIERLAQAAVAVKALEKLDH